LTKASVSCAARVALSYRRWPQEPLRPHNLDSPDCWEDRRIAAGIRVLFGGAQPAQRAAQIGVGDPALTRGIGTQMILHDGAAQLLQNGRAASQVAAQQQRAP